MMTSYKIMSRSTKFKTRLKNYQWGLKIGFNNWQTKLIPLRRVAIILSLNSLLRLLTGDKKCLMDLLLVSRELSIKRVDPGKIILPSLFDLFWIIMDFDCRFCGRYSQPLLFLCFEQWYQIAHLLSSFFIVHKWLTNIYYLNCFVIIIFTEYYFIFTLYYLSYYPRLLSKIFF